MKPQRRQALTLRSLWVGVHILLLNRLKFIIYFFIAKTVINDDCFMYSKSEQK